MLYAYCYEIEDRLSNELKDNMKIAVEKLMGTHSDKEKSLACYKKGAELGDYGAIYALARNCRAADGIWLDIKRAMGYLHRVVSEENIWQNPARVLMAQAFLAQHPGKFVRQF